MHWYKVQKVFLFRRLTSFFLPKTLKKLLVDVTTQQTVDQTCSKSMKQIEKNRMELDKSSGSRNKSTSKQHDQKRKVIFISINFLIKLTSNNEICSE